jgi:hypothetical protein
MPKKKSEYPRCEQIGVVIFQEPIPHISRSDLQKCLDKAGLDQDKYGELYGIQTQYVSGPYPWDVEAVLERMMSGKLTGTQLLMD